LGAWLVAGIACAGETSAFVNTVSGATNAVPAGYVPPLISNGSLCMLIDYLGGQTQRSYVHMTPTIFWEGHRYGPPKDQLIPFGYFDADVSADGRKLGVPATWSQTLDTASARVTCRNVYAGGLTIETEAFCPFSQDVVAVRKRVVAANPAVRSVQLTFGYHFGSPRRVVCTPAWNAAAQRAEFRFTADAHQPCDGLVAVFADRPVAGAVDGRNAALTADVALDGGRPAEVTFFLVFEDSLGGKAFVDRAAQAQTRLLAQGFDGLFADHRKAWAAYWNESYVRLPDAKLARAYCTAQYHLRANATKWSFPVGVFNTHWAGRFFGWDEMFCYQALVSSNHRDIARRGPEFRRAGLKIALDRAAHYGKPGLYGAHYPWETLEDGSEATPPGFWLEHVFHMSNIALAAWFQYLYTDDRAYLEKTGYPVIKECARFFLANMVCDLPDGRAVIGKCTDLERLGPAKSNPFMTSCGAIYTLESAAKAAAVLGADADEAAAWTLTAKKLRESLPVAKDRYVPYAGCRDESVASLGGLFPYPVFDETSAFQKNAVYNYVKNGRAFGNMYQMGTSVCAWYLGWMAAALAEVGDTAEPVKMLDEAADGAGCFGEMFEINEANVSRTPWFSTASGNVVYALNQMLVQNREDGQIRLMQGVPAAWRDYAFKLACHGDLAVEVEIKDGRLERLSLLPGDPAREHRRTLVVPAALLEGVPLNKECVRGESALGPNARIDVGFKGRAELVNRR
jgi:hypothetical protein